MYGRLPPLLSGNGKKGWYDDMFFRSLLEMLFIHHCKNNNMEITSAETKDFKVLYEFEGKERTYRPDFYLPEYDTIVEVKPSNLVNTNINSCKFKAASKKFKNFLVLTEKDINRLNKKDLQKLLESERIKLL